MKNRYVFTNNDREVAKKSRKKIYKYDWDEIQIVYDSGLSFSELIKKYGMSSRTITKAVRRGQLKSRSVSEAMSLLLKNNPEKNPMKNPNARKKLSEYAKKHKYGGYKKGSGRGKGQWYVSPIAGKIYLDSSYEVEYAKYLDENNIKWKRNTDRFKYNFKNEEHDYIPDFYLIELNEYIETKGYKTDKDLAKWKKFPYKLTILMRKDLLKMGLKVK